MKEHNLVILQSSNIAILQDYKIVKLTEQLDYTNFTSEEGNHAFPFSVLKLGKIDQRRTFDLKSV